MLVSDRKVPPRSLFASSVQVLGLLLLVLPLTGCAFGQFNLKPKPVAGVCQPAMVFVADGAGDFQLASRYLKAVCQADHYPICIRTFEWSHGYLRILADQTQYPHVQNEGRQLAAEVVDYHRRNPQMPIYLAGHSAGTAVILVALENLPAGIVDRAFLLSPSVSSYYDVRPSLQNVNRGLHVYYSHVDYLYLGIATRIVGTTDRQWTSASGRTGFFMTPQCEDDGLYAKLYQRPWSRSDRLTGNNGNHYGNYEPDFLRTHIIPLMQPQNLPYSFSDRTKSTVTSLDFDR